MQDFDLKTELSESDWIESESLRLLMRQRLSMTWFSSGTMAAMAIQLYDHTNPVLIGFWLLVSVVTVMFRHHIKTVFNQHFLNSSLADQILLLKRNELAWTLSAFT
jgi:hypothetical protein